MLIKAVGYGLLVGFISYKVHFARFGSRFGSKGVLDDQGLPLEGRAGQPRWLGLRVLGLRYEPWLRQWRRQESAVRCDRRRDS